MLNFVDKFRVSRIVLTNSLCLFIYFADKGVIQAQGELWKNFNKMCLATFDRSGK